MRQRGLMAWLTGLTVLATLLAPVAAVATETDTFHFSGIDSRAEVDPCSGAPGTVEIVFSGVIHSTNLEDGTYHVSVTTTGTVTFVPDEPSEPTYTGQLAEQFGQHLNSRNSTITNAENVVLQGSDGSVGKQHILFHLTVNANGTVTSSIDIEEFTLSSPGGTRTC